MTTSHLQIRPSDCDVFGHVNNAAYVSFVQYALAAALTDLGLSQDWTREGGCFWRLKSLSIEYRRPAFFSDLLTNAIWLEQPDLANPVFGSEVKRIQDPAGPDSEQPICRARSAWQRICRHTGEPVPLADSVLLGLPRTGGTPPRPFELPPDPVGLASYHWHHTVMVSEVETSGYVRPQSLYEWLQQGVFEASAQAGWPTEKRLAAGFVTFQTRHDTEILAYPCSGDSVRVTSRAIQVLRLRGTWYHEVHRLPAEELLLRDHSTGVFLDLSGRPTTPSDDMMNAIQFGAR
jgi:acyl-CoA thioester hydrolase